MSMSAKASIWFGIEVEKSETPFFRDEVEVKMEDWWLKEAGWVEPFVMWVGGDYNPAIPESERRAKSDEWWTAKQAFLKANPMPLGMEFIGDYDDGETVGIYLPESRKSTEWESMEVTMLEITEDEMSKFTLALDKYFPGCGRPSWRVSPLYG